MLKRYLYNKLFLTLTILGIGVTFTSCDTKKPESNSTVGLTTVVCDESFENILSQEIDVFENTYRKASVMPYYVSENAAIDSLLKLKTRLIIVSNKLNPKQEQYLKDKQGSCLVQRIAVDAIALIVNKDNPIDSLSMSQLNELLSGKKMLWKEFNDNKGDSIRVVFDNAGSSIVKYMSDSILKGESYTKNIYAQKSNPGVFKAVENNKNAIGIIGVSWISSDMNSSMAEEESSNQELEKADTTNSKFNDSIKVLKIYRDGAKKAYKPYQAYIYDGSYPLYRNIYAISTSQGGSVTHGFYAFLTGFIGQKIIMKTGILPSVIHPRMVNLN